MSKKATPKAGGDKVALFDALVAKFPKVERKGATMPYTSVNGNMFSLLTPQGDLALRLPSPEREAFLKKHKTSLCKQYGVVMKEYVRVPAALLESTHKLAPYFELSHRYASALKAKATTRKKVAKQSKARTAKGRR